MTLQQPTIQDSVGPQQGPPLPPKPLITLSKVNYHKVDDQDLVEIAIMDEPGPGGAHHSYLIFWPGARGIQSATIQFQKGPILENGVNGITNEVLLALVRHRLTCFQSGPFPNDYNAEALGHVKAAMEQLHARTRERRARGVEGKTQA